MSFSGAHAIRVPDQPLEMIVVSTTHVKLETKGQIQLRCGGAGLHREDKDSGSAPGAPAQIAQYVFSNTISEVQPSKPHSLKPTGRDMSN